MRSASTSSAEAKITSKGVSGPMASAGQSGDRNRENHLEPSMLGINVGIITNYSKIVAMILTPSDLRILKRVKS